MRLLDLCCCAGGAGVGYKRAGFDEVVGVDIRRHVHYPYLLHKGEVIDLLEYLLQNPVHNEFDATRHSVTRWYSLSDFDAVHISPPCQDASSLTAGTNQHLEYPQIIPDARRLLDATGLPYVIENVPAAPMRADIELCGEMFGLKVIRHRIFEFGGGLIVPQPRHLEHRGPVKGYRGKDKREGYYFPVYGRGGGKGTPAEWQDAMGIDWTKSRVELAEAIPPAYTEYIGKYLIDHIQKVAA